MTTFLNHIKLSLIWAYDMYACEWTVRDLVCPRCVQ